MTAATAGLDAEYRTRLEQAAQWRIRLQESPEVGHSAEFLLWTSDANNQAALDDIALAWDAVEVNAASAELIALRSTALADARKSAKPRWRFQLLPLRAIAATLLVSAGIGVAAYIYVGIPVRYSTANGERRIVTLADGSQLSLDADTEVTVRYSRAMRQLVLDRGRARFEVSHDIARPFTVKADAETVLAVGTNFDVERLDEKVIVTLLQGQVVVRAGDGKAAPQGPTPGAQSEQSVMLKAGERLIARSGAPFSVAPADISSAVSWERARFEFYDEPLSDAVARINRYARIPISVDPEAAQLRISGVFHADDTNAFIEAVTNYLPVDAIAANERIVLQARRNGHP
jgi:transmembrane sensor